MTGNNELLVLILILLEVTQIIIRELYLLPLIRLNPYSTGSNSNKQRRTAHFLQKSLNPYSTGSNSNSHAASSLTHTKNVLILILLEVTQISWTNESDAFALCLNPYSTGSNSNTLIINNLFFTLCFVYFS